jgi:hypothetical protein
VGMPWEGAEERKQKQGMNNARQAYVLHVYEKDYGRLATLLAFAKEWKVWHKYWGNTAFTVEIPNEKSSQAEKFVMFRWYRLTDLFSSAWARRCSTV